MDLRHNGPLLACCHGCHNPYCLFTQGCASLSGPRFLVRTWRSTPNLNPLWKVNHCTLNWVSFGLSSTRTLQSPPTIPLSWHRGLRSVPPDERTVVPILSAPLDLLLSRQSLLVPRLILSLQLSAREGPGPSSPVQDRPSEADALWTAVHSPITRVAFPYDESNFSLGLSRQRASK